MAIGGKRKGAGRHPVPNKKIKKCITLRPDHIEKMAGEKASGIIEKALDKYFKGDMMEKLIAKIEKDGISEILEIAINNWVEGFDSVVHYNPDTDRYTSECWTGNTYLSPDSTLTEVYRLAGNWIANASFETNDIISDEEYEEIEKILAENDDMDDDVCITHQEHLDLIGVNLKSRLLEFLENATSDIEEEIIRSLRSGY